MKKTLAFALALAAVAALTLAALAQDPPEKKPQPDSENVMRDKMVKMQDLLREIKESLTDNEDNEVIMKAYKELEELYRDVEKGKITNKVCKETMKETWKVAQETVVPRLKEIAPEMFKEKPEDKPKPKSDKEKDKKKDDKGSTTPGSKKSVVKVREGAEYYPLETGMAWTYRSGGAEALVNISRKEKLKGHDCFVVETISGVKLQQRRWLYVTGEGIYVAKDWYKKGKKTVEYDPPLPIAKFPIKKGQKWKWAGKNAAGRTISFTAEVKGSKTVTVPAGTFTGLEVVTLRNVGGYVQKLSEVLAPGVGLVYMEQEIIKMPGGKDKRTLKLVKYTKPEGKKDK